MSIMRPVAACLILALVGFAIADDAQSRMDELNRRAATRPAASHPATRPASKPLAPPAAKKRIWKLRAGAPNELQKVIEQQDAGRAAAVKRVEAEIATEREFQKTSRKDGHTSAADQRVMKNRSETLKAKLQGTLDGTVLILDEVEGPGLIESGFIGRSKIPCTARVMQVIDSRSAIVDLNYTIQTSRVVQVGDTQDVVPDIATGSVPAWLSGVDTSKTVDGRDLPGTLEFFIAKPNRTYTTRLGGSRTILELVPFSLSDFELVPQE